MNTDITYLYYAKFYDDELSLYKIGTSCDVYRRVSGLTPKGMRCKLLLMERFETRKLALEAERIVKNSSSNQATEYRHMPVTETFLKDVLNLDYENTAVLVYKHGLGMVRMCASEV